MSQPGDKSTSNYVEDLALTQTMFKNGTLICQGDAQEFVNIMNNSKASKAESDSINEYLEHHPNLLKSIIFQVEESKDDSPITEDNLATS